MIEINLTKMRESIIEGWHATLEGLQDPRVIAENLQNLTLAKKIEIAVVALVLMACAAMLYINRGYWSGRQDETKIVFYTQQKKLGNGKVATLSILSGDQGRLELVDAEGQHGVRFIAGAAACWRDQWARLQKIRDPETRILTLAAIGAAEKRGWGLPGDVALSKEQALAEAALRQELERDASLLDESALSGAFNNSDVEKLFDTLGRLQEASDARKAALKDQLMQAGIRYAERLEDAREKRLAKYVDDLRQLLEPAQHEALKQAAEQVALRSGAPKEG